MNKGETDLCRERLLKYCNGQGLDLGCGSTKIKSEAIGIDLLSPIADMRMDARLMPCYKDGHFDYIFSSHLLEEIEDTESTLREWLRIIKNDGHIVLYQADKNLYPAIGSPQCNHNHKHHFNWEDLWDIFKKIGGVELRHHAVYSNKPYKEWSFEIVVKKKDKQIKEKEKVGTSYEGISILIPTLNRPQNIKDFTSSVEDMTEDPNEIEIVFGIHEEDIKSKDMICSLMPTLKINIRYEIIKRHEDGSVHLSFLWNQLYEKAKYPIIGYFGDDVLFRSPGWDKEIKREFAMDKNILVSCNDVHIQQGKNATLFFTHKNVHNRFGFYLNAKFKRWYMDTYWDMIFKHAGKLHYRQDIVTEHLHPDEFPERLDATYRAMEGNKKKDRQIWMSQENKKEMEINIKILKELE